MMQRLRGGGNLMRSVVCPDRLPKRLGEMRYRQALIGAATLLLAAGCGHGHESSIGKGFTFIDSGGNDKKIVFNGEPPSSVVIDARVDRYTRDATKIIAARRPLVDHALTPACEYWIIDTGTRVAHRIPDAAQWPEVHCDNP
jgi:hypothetical protein